MNIDQDVIEGVLTDAQNHLIEKIDEKGSAAFNSPHETYGVVAEEVMEFLAAVHSGDHQNQEDELLDIVVAALWGVASLRAHKNKEEAP